MHASAWQVLSSHAACCQQLPSCPPVENASQLSPELLYRALSPPAALQPHFHGSSAVQTATAKGVILVGGEENILPAGGAAGCAALRSALLAGGLHEWVLQASALSCGAEDLPACSFREHSFLGGGPGARHAAPPGGWLQRGLGCMATGPRGAGRCSRAELVCSPCAFKVCLHRSAPCFERSLESRAGLRPCSPADRGLVLRRHCHRAPSWPRWPGLPRERPLQKRRPLQGRP